MIGGNGKNIFGVGVAVLKMNNGGRKMISPGVFVIAGSSSSGVSVSAGTAAGTIGAGGATIEASVLGMHSAIVTLPAIHA